MTTETTPHALLEEALACARASHYGKARALAVEAHDTAPRDGLLQARAANLLGGIAFEQGRLHEAEGRYERVLRLGRLLNEEELVARAANNLASIANLRGKHQLATSLYQSALKVWESLGDQAGIAQCCHNLSILARQGGLLWRAMEFSERAVQAARETGDRALLGLTCLGRAEAALAVHDHPAAHQNLELGLRLARGTGDWLGVADGRRVEALLALAEGRPGAALRAALAGHHRARRLGSHQVAAECAEIAGRASAELNRRPESARFYRMARQGFAALGLTTTPAVGRVMPTIPLAPDHPDGAQPLPASS